MLNTSNYGATSALANKVSPGDTLIHLTPGGGARFVVPAGDHFYVTLREEGKQEFVKVTSVSGDSLVVVRGQGGSTQQSFRAGACVVEEWSPPMLTEFVQLLSSGLGPSGVEAGTYCLTCNTCIDVDATGRITGINNPGGCA